MNRLDATEHLRREMHEIRSLLESALPCLGSPGGQSRTPVKITSSSQEATMSSAPSDDQQASEVPANQVFQPEACHAIAGPSVVVNAESEDRVQFNSIYSSKHTLVIITNNHCMFEGAH